MSDFLWSDGLYVYPHVIFTKIEDRTGLTVAMVDCRHCASYDKFIGIDILASVFVNNFGQEHKNCINLQNEKNYLALPCDTNISEIYCSICNDSVIYTSQISFDIMKETDGPVMAICDKCLKKYPEYCSEKPNKWLTDDKSRTIFCNSFIITSNTTMRYLGMYNNFKSYKTTILQPGRSGFIKPYKNVYVICLK